MKKIHYILWVGLGLYPSSSVFSQVLNQDAEGNSTLYLEGGSIGLDINKTEAAITYNQSFLKVGNSEGKYSRNLLFGLAAKSKNETGLAGLFDNGKFVPGGSVSAKFGCFWSSSFNSKKAAFDTAIAQYNLNKSQRNLDAIAKARKEMADQEAKLSYNRTVLFLEGGFLASGFNLREEMGTVNTWSNLSKKENFVAPFLRLAVNFQHEGWLNGFSIGYAKGNNLDELTSEKLNFTKTDTLSDGIVTRESSKDVYRRSEYKIFDKITFNYDLVKVFPLKPRSGTPQGFMALNLVYIRYGMTNYTGQFRVDEKPNHKLNLGTGVHFFDNRGKFLGGLYVQMTDVANWDNKSKWGEKISFGIVTRFNVQAVNTAY